MHATFPLRKSFLLQGALLTGVFSLVLVVLILIPLLSLNLSREEWIPLAFMMWGPHNALYVGMLLLSVWILLAGIRAKVIVHENRVTDCGTFRRKEFDLREVTSAQWQLRGRSRRPCLTVNTPAVWVPFDFRIHRNEDARRLIQFFRHVLPPEIQEGWTPEWEELAVSLESTPALGNPTVPKLIRACLLAGVGAGLIFGVIAQIMLWDLPATMFSWSGSIFVDWTAYGIAASLGFSVPLLALLLLYRLGQWLDK